MRYEAIVPMAVKFPVSLHSRMVGFAVILVHNPSRVVRRYWCLTIFRSVMISDGDARVRDNTLCGAAWQWHLGKVNLAAIIMVVEAVLPYEYRTARLSSALRFDITCC